MVRCTVAKSRTTNVASSSSRGADRFVAVDLLLANPNSNTYGHCMGIREGKGVKHEQGEMRIHARTFFFFLSEVGADRTRFAPFVHSQVQSAALNKMLASRQVLRVSAQKQFSPALAARSCTFGGHSFASTLPSALAAPRRRAKECVCESADADLRYRALSQSRRSLVLLRSPSRLPLFAPRSLAPTSSPAPVSRPPYALPGQLDDG